MDIKSWCFIFSFYVWFFVVWLGFILLLVIFRKIIYFVFILYCGVLCFFFLKVCLLIRVISNVKICLVFDEVVFFGWLDGMCSKNERLMLWNL